MMKLLANPKIKLLFSGIILCMFIFTVISVLLLGFGTENAALYILAGALGMGIAILMLCFRYFREQNKIMEEAVSQIVKYISGGTHILIECDDDGELYRLFHEVNLLVSILNAHAENEKNAKRAAMFSPVSAVSGNDHTVKKITLPHPKRLLMLTAGGSGLGHGNLL